MENKLDYLWAPTDKKGRRVFTPIPNALLGTMMDGVYTLVELKVILYICRMSFAFRRDETNDLSLGDFQKGTHINKTHLCKAIKSLLDKALIFRSRKSGGKAKYAVNLLAYGLKMKLFKISNALSPIE